MKTNNKIKIVVYPRKKEQEFVKRFQTPLYFVQEFEDDLVLQDFKTGDVQLDKWRTAAGEMARGIKAYMETLKADDELMDYIIIRQEDAVVSSQTEQHTSGGGTTHTDRNAGRRFENEPTKVFMFGTHPICGLCFDRGDGGEHPRGSHNTVTEAEMKYCKSKNLPMAMCKNHQREFWENGPDGKKLMKKEMKEIFELAEKSEDYSVALVKD